MSDIKYAKLPSDLRDIANGNWDLECRRLRGLGHSDFVHTNVTARIYDVLGINNQSIPKYFEFDGLVDGHHVRVFRNDAKPMRTATRHYFQRAFFVIDTMLVPTGRIRQYLEGKDATKRSSDSFQGVHV